MHHLNEIKTRNVDALLLVVILVVVGAKIRILWPILEVLFIFPLGVILEIFGAQVHFFLVSGDLYSLFVDCGDSRHCQNGAL